MASVRQRTERVALFRTSSRGLIFSDTALKGLKKMLQTIAIILVILWALGLVTSTTMGGFIHILLVLAVIVIAIRLIQGRSI